MKILVIILISLFVFTNKCFAASYKIIWENTNINIKLNDSYTKYLNIPKAKLYIDNVLIEDAVFNYDYTGDFLYYSKDIDTSKVGSYKVYYKVNETKYRPGTCYGYKQIITFNVIDDIAPSINVFNDCLSVKINTKIKDVFDSKLISVMDNYCANDEISINAVMLDENLVELNKVTFDVKGNFNLKIIATDKYQNKTEKIIKIKVLDNTGPKVLYLGLEPLILEINEELEFDKLFKLSDDDGIKSIKPVIKNLDKSKENKGEATFIFSDIYDNLTEITIKYEVYKEIKPIINLKEQNIVLDYKTDIKKINFKDYLIDARYKNLICSEDVSISHNILNKVGIYDVNFKVNKDNKETIKVLSVKLVSSVKPQITTKDAYLHVGDMFNIKEYVTIYDESDDNVIDSIEIKSEEIDTNKEGTYYVTFIVKNSSDLFNQGTVKVIISNNYNFFNTKNIIIISLIVIVSLIGGIYYYLEHKKKQKNNIINL